VADSGGTADEGPAQGRERAPEQTGAQPGAQTGEQAGPLSYEEARDELASVVKRLEAGGLTLEQSLELWERGERLAAVCERLLEGARARLAAVTAARSGDAEPGAPF
jgi:exodeoxyribonuclease VII small subunit